MQKLGLRQTLSQKLSPQQIQFIKLLQIPTAELDMRIQEEMESNPALDDGTSADASDLSSDYNEEGDNNQESATTDDADTDEYADSLSKEDAEVDLFNSNDLSIDDYVNQDEIAGYKMYGDGFDPNQEDPDRPTADISSFVDSLHTQLGLLDLTETQVLIGRQIIGSLDSDGYLRRDPEAICNDLAFRQNLPVDLAEVMVVLELIKEFDPPGVAAADLRECLLLQLKRRPENDLPAKLAFEIISNHFEEFTRKHYDKIFKKLDITNEESFKDAIQLITKLNPRPGDVGGANIGSMQIIPDFLARSVNGRIEISLNSANSPELKISRQYKDMLDHYSKATKVDKKYKEAVSFVKQKLDAASWFIDAIRQRQLTLMRTMTAIADFQPAFFNSGDEGQLKPMILKDIADQIGMDISTVSRVVSSKYVQTDFGVYPLKYFFSEGISTESGEDASSREVKHIIKQLIESEEKGKPLSDERIGELLNQKGYNIARRTVAKYREQLNIPVARLRREI